MGMYDPRNLKLCGFIDDFLSWDQKLKTVAAYNKLLDLEPSYFTWPSFGQNRQLKVIQGPRICLSPYLTDSSQNQAHMYPWLPLSWKTR